MNNSSDKIIIADARRVRGTQRHLVQRGGQCSAGRNLKKAGDNRRDLGQKRVNFFALTENTESADMTIKELFDNENNTICCVQETLAFNIKAYRERMGYTREEFADKIGYTPQYIGQIEAGQKLPSVEVICELAQEIGVSVGMLLSACWPFTASEYIEEIISACDNRPLAEQEDYFRKLLELAKEERERVQ